MRCALLAALLCLPIGTWLIAAEPSRDDTSRSNATADDNSHRNDNGKKDNHPNNGKGNNKKNDNKKNDNKKEDNKKNEKKDDDKDDPAKPPARADFFFLPLNVHVLTAEGRPDINCQLTDADYRRILNKMNRIWRQAGIQFYAPTILREPAQHLAEFDKREKEIVDNEEEKARQHYRLLTSPDTAKLAGFHVYYVRKIQPRGTYLGNSVCFIKETAELREVEGGTDEPLARVTAHELGHALGLRHRKDEKTNLMGASTTGTRLNQAEEKLARTNAARAEGRLTYAEARKKEKELEDAGKTREAELLQKLLNELE